MGHVPQSREKIATKIQQILHLILAKRPRSDTEASLPREGAPGFPSLEYGGQYAVPESRSRSLEPTVDGRYEHVADIDALVLLQKCHKKKAAKYPTHVQL